MPRKGPAPKNPVIADPVYNSPVVTALINKVLSHGKLSTAGLTLSSARFNVMTGSTSVFVRQFSSAL